MEKRRGNKTPLNMLKLKLCSMEKNNIFQVKKVFAQGFNKVVSTEA